MFLDTLYGDAPRSSLMELRYRVRTGMRRRFFGVGARRLVVNAIADLADATDVYLGVLPRRRPRGGRDDVVREGSVVWADCDTSDAATALEVFVPAPSMIVATGTPQHSHAYWLLSVGVPVVEIENANRRLAAALHADPACVDGARILRPAGTLNHKRRPVGAVRIEHCDSSARLSVHDVVASLPSLSPEAWSVARPWHVERAVGNDPLLAVPPPVFVERLLGVAVPRHGKVRCPLHDDRTPSLHVYDEPERGWYCFGCNKGGSIYDLAAAVRRITTRRANFVALRRELTDCFILRS